jgi:hypothetical protein
MGVGEDVVVSSPLFFFSFPCPEENDLVHRETPVHREEARRSPVHCRWLEGLDANLDLHLLPAAA